MCVCIFKCVGLDLDEIKDLIKIFIELFCECCIVDVYFLRKGRGFEFFLCVNILFSV